MASTLRLRAVRSVAVVVLGYVVFAGSAALLFQLSGQGPHAAASAGFMVLTVVYGVGFAALGGWLAARLAGAHPVGHAAAVAALIAAGAIASLLFAGASHTWSMWSTLVLRAPSALLGGVLRSRAGRASPRGGAGRAAHA